MVFAGEDPAFLEDGVQPASDPSSSRNLAVVKLDINGDPVGGGEEETGIAYNFWGEIEHMSHKGVQWLTSYNDL
jgi:hypothetical protein